MAAAPARRPIAGPNVNPRNPHNPMPAVRALLVALEDWVVSGKAPPPSRVPTLADGTLVEADKTGFPDIPGAAVVRVTNVVAPTRRLGEPARRRSRLSHAGEPGRSPTATRWPASACPTSPCRSPPTPAGTSTRRRIPAGEIADRDGSYFAFPAAKIAQRYTDRADYVAKVQAAVDELMKRPADAAGRCRPLSREGAQRSAGEPLMAKLDRNGVTIHYEVHGKRTDDPAEPRLQLDLRACGTARSRR